MSGERAFRAPSSSTVVAGDEAFRALILDWAEASAELFDDSLCEFGGVREGFGLRGEVQFLASSLAAAQAELARAEARLSVLDAQVYELNDRTSRTILLLPGSERLRCTYFYLLGLGFSAAEIPPALHRFGNLLPVESQASDSSRGRSATRRPRGRGKGKGSRKGKERAFD